MDVYRTLGLHDPKNIFTTVNSRRSKQGHGEYILIFKQVKDHRVSSQKQNRTVAVSSFYKVRSMRPLWSPFIR